jgi:hypothetical protein
MQNYNFICKLAKKIVILCEILELCVKYYLY